MKTKTKKNVSLELVKPLIIENEAEEQSECSSDIGVNLCYDLKQRTEVINHSRKTNVANLKPVITCSKCVGCKFQEYSVTAELAYVYMLLSENIANEEILAILRNKYDWSAIDETIKKKKNLLKEREYQDNLHNEIDFRKSDNYKPCETYLWAK